MTETIQNFYQAFKNLDAETMTSFYADNVEFDDPAFGTLKGDRAKKMWQMLCESQKGKNFTIEFSNISGDSEQGSAKWEAFYTFSKTGRKVHNKISAQFMFSDGKIVKHTDRFDLHRWARQAMGFKGFLLGGTSFFRRQLHAQTNAMLDRFIEEQKK